MALAEQEDSVSSIYDSGLDRNPANFAALSPVSFVERAAEVFGDLPAVVHGARQHCLRDVAHHA